MWPISASLAAGHIRRRDGQRMVTVSAEVDAEVITAGKLTEKVIETFAALASGELPGYQMVFLGEKRESDQALEGMTQALLIALGLIFFILTVLFKSLLDPLVVMFVIPFSFIGVVIGHALFGYNLQFLSIIGLLALSGIVVNDSLILVDFIKHLRAKGHDRIDAAVEAAGVRARPILLTTITTFVGISPLIFFSSGQTAFLAPMAVSLGFGLVFTTFLILLGLPCFYLIAGDGVEWLGRRMDRG